MPDTIDAALRLSPSVTSLAKTDDEADSPNEVRHDVHTERAQGGVARIEDLYKVFNGKKIWLLYAAIGLIVYASSLELNTTPNYLSFATSAYGRHAFLGTISSANSILSAVSLPFIAKLADTVSRPAAYLFCLVWYILGLVLIAASKDVDTLAAGQVLYTIGCYGVQLTTSIITADITSTQWRGLTAALVALPNLVNAFVSGYIVEDITLTNWRWGYGMFGIILPVCFAPTLIVLFVADAKAKKLSVDPGQSSANTMRAVEGEQRGIVARVGYYLTLIDAVGLVLIGFGFSLVLLPFNLANGARGGWANPSMIAMEVVGWVILALFGLWEAKFAKYPLAPMRVFNRTFTCCALLNVLYFLSFYLANAYYTSYTYVVRINDWSTRDWTFFGRIITVGGCTFSFAAGAVLRIAKGYKPSLVFGVSMLILGMGIQLYATNRHATDGPMVMAQVIASIGEAFTIIASATAAQASVPHADLATAIALLSMLTGVGGAVGYTVAGAVWTKELPVNLATTILPLVDGNQTVVDAIFGDLVTAAYQPEPIYSAVVEAYNKTVRLPLFVPALCVMGIMMVFALATPEMKLGDRHNAVEDKKVDADFRANV